MLDDNPRHFMRVVGTNVIVYSKVSDDVWYQTNTVEDVDAHLRRIRKGHEDTDRLLEARNIVKAMHENREAARSPYND